MDATMTKNKIIAGAKQIFFTRGFDAATLVEIAEVSGVNQALINYHFRTKKSLYRFTVLQILDREIYPRILKVINEEDTIKRIEQLGDLSRTIIRDYPRFLLIMLNRRDLVYNDIMLWIEQKNKFLERNSANIKTKSVNMELNKVQDKLVLFVLSMMPVILKGYFAPVLTEASEHLIEILIKNINTTLFSLNEGDRGSQY